MEKKKLIGAIIGVICFVVLIAGATFAWLNATANVVNGIYNVGTKNFVINYTKGSDITGELPHLVSATPATATKKIEIHAYRAASSAPGNITIKLTSTSTGTLTTSGVIKYALCKSDTTGTGCTSFNTAGGQVASGSITGSTKDLYTEAIQTETGENVKNYYTIYLWIDAAGLANEHIGQTYSGYVHASAVQTES